MANLYELRNKIPDEQLVSALEIACKSCKLFQPDCCNKEDVICTIKEYLIAYKLKNRTNYTTIGERLHQEKIIPSGGNSKPSNF